MSEKPADAVAAEPAQALEAAGGESTIAALETAAPSGPDQPPAEVKLYGETAVDKVSSFLMSLILGVSFAVGWLFLQYITNEAFAARETKPLEIIEVAGGTGGSPDVDPGSTQAINVAGGAEDRFASNNMEEASAFEEPQIEATTQTLLDAFIETPDDIMNVDLAEALPNAGPVASGRRASKIGNAKIGYGLGGGPGEGGVSREQRWVIVYNPGQTPEEYARQLDFFGIEFAVPSGQSSMEYVSKFSAGTPARRTALARGDTRLYFLWQGAGRKAQDITLLQRAGVQVGSKPIFHFYPRPVEDQLVQAEVSFAGRQPYEIKSTQFSVVASGDGYAFRVIRQEPLQ
jgi:hypothetical protein